MNNSLLITPVGKNVCAANHQLQTKEQSMPECSTPGSKALATLQKSLSDGAKPFPKGRIHQKKAYRERRKSASLIYFGNPPPPPSLSIERIFSGPPLEGARLEQLKISPDGKRVTFLKARTDHSSILDLWEYNIDKRQSRLLVDSSAIADILHPLSKREQDQRERLRLFDKGIVEYEWSPKGDALLFPLGNKLFYHTLTAGVEPPTKCLTACEQGQTDVRFSPLGNYVSFVRDQNLYIIDLKNGEEKQLTMDGQGAVSNGLAEFIAQEEMERFEGYWWSGDENFIAFFQVDESPINHINRFEVKDNKIDVVEERYPRTGTANAKMKLGVVDVAEGSLTILKDISNNQDCYYARCNWLPDNKRVAVQVQHRDQKKLDLITVNARTGDAAILLRRRRPTWITLDDDLYFLSKSDDFIWTSDYHNLKHLYLYDKNGSLKHPITIGSCWVQRLLGVDEEAGVVYFTGYDRSPLENHLYKAPINPTNGETPTRITHRHGWHEPKIFIEKQYYIDTYSDPNTPPQVTLNRLDGTRIGSVEENKLHEGHPYFPYSKRHSQAEFGSLKAADGQTLYYSLLKPSPFDPQKKYPVIVDVYGGPNFRKVKKKWAACSGSWHQFMASRGYILFSLDNRGSSDRGLSFEYPIYKQLGNVEVEDQKTGVDFLRTLPFVDKERIGVFGWSYGGYMALMLMMKAPDYFHAGISVAPVTDWTLYDTHYTERYLGNPETNKESYKLSSVFPYIDGLKGPLLVIHGMSDDNVLFQNSAMLYQALQAKNKPFEMMNYPASKHAIAGLDMRRHLYEHNITPFFDKHLGKKMENCS